MCKTFVILSLLVVALLAVRAQAADDSALAGLRALLPTPGTVLIDDEDPAVLTQGGTANDTWELMTDNAKDAAPGGKSLRMHVGQAINPPYRVQVFSSKSAADLHKGDTVLVGYWLRAPEATGSAIGVATMRLQMYQAPWDAPAALDSTFDAKWRQVFAAGVAEKDFPSGILQIALQIGQQHQTIDVGPLVVLNLGPGVKLSALPHNRIAWPGMEADAPWRGEAQRRIEQYRMTDLSVTVTDAAGQTVPNAQVHIQQQRRAFTFGSFVEEGNPTPLVSDTPNGDKDRAVFLHLFNRATCPIYWADWCWPTRKDDVLAIAKWLQDHDYTVRGHVMVYPTFKYLPKELQQLKNDPTKLQARILQHIDEIAEATKPYGFREYDVTNELRYCDDIYKIVGKDAVAEWYAEARRHLPNAKLALNENTILTDGGVTQINQDIYLDWYRFLKSKGQAPDVLGFQSHFGENFTAPETVWAIIDRFAKETDAELQITEFDINTLDEQVQAAYTRDFLTACFADPHITAFNMWGFWEPNHWLPHAAFYRKDWSLKPNGKVLEELLTKTWWTDSKVTTDAAGKATVKAFLGTQRVTVTAGDKSASKDAVLEKAGEAVGLGIKVE